MTESFEEEVLNGLTFKQYGRVGVANHTDDDVVVHYNKPVADEDVGSPILPDYVPDVSCPQCNEFKLYPCDISNETVMCGNCGVEFPYAALQNDDFWWGFYYGYQHACNN